MTTTAINSNANAQYNEAQTKCEIIMKTKNTEARYIITTENNAVLHSDNRFYNAYLQLSGCSYCVYKHKYNAQKRANKISARYNLTLKIKEVTEILNNN